MLNLYLKQFEDAIFDAMNFVAISKIVLFQGDLQDFIEKIKIKTGNCPKEFNLFLILENLIKGENVELPPDIKIDNDKFSKIVVNIIKAFGNNLSDYKKFADNK